MLCVLSESASCICVWFAKFHGLQHLSTSVLCINRVYLNIFMGSCIVQTRLDSRESSKINGEETLPIMRRGIRRPNG